MGRGKIIGIAKLSRRGLMVLPKEVREALALKDGDQVVFVEEGKRIYVLKGPIKIEI